MELRDKVVLRTWLVRLAEGRLTIWAAGENNALHVH